MVVRTRSMRLLVVVAAVAVGVGGTTSCVALFGVDELRYAPPAGGAGGVHSAGGGGGGAATGGGGIVGDCASPDCDTCRQSDCALSACPDVAAACVQSQDCSVLAACISDCAETDADCLADCLKAHPSSVNSYYAAEDCTACGANTCAAACQAHCQGCSEGSGDCGSCVNGSCAQPRCPVRVEACALSPECTTFMDCIMQCGDTACYAQCGAQSPQGAVAYYDLALCVYCTRPTCRALCVAAQQVDCSALAAGQFGFELCNDGIDNDGDAHIDCDDPDCAGQSPCP